MPTIDLEKSYWDQGLNNIVGLDEAGRGPWAGPVSAGAVLINSAEQVVAGVNDSKKLNESTREQLFKQIVKLSTGWGIGIVQAEEIDRIGLAEAVRKAMNIALESLIAKADKSIDILIIDGAGVRNLEGYKCLKVDKGDFNHYSIAAASILAKVSRDRIMKELGIKYPAYGFEKHKGYGTAFHQEALKINGACEIHRKSFKPILKFL